MYYPMDRREYDKKIRGRNTYWLRYGRKSLIGVSKNFGSKDDKPSWIFNYLRGIKMNTV